MNRRISSMSDDDDDDDSSSSTSSSESERFSDEEVAAIQKRRKSGFASMMHDWMGDERSVVSGVSALDLEDEQQQQQSKTAAAPAMRAKKKKIVPVTPSSSSSSGQEPSSTTTNNKNSRAPTQRCYLVSGTDTQGSLIEHYSKTTLDSYLAYWTPPPGKKIPPFKFTANWGKSELINSTQGDLKGKFAYYSGVCQWLRKAKTFDGTIQFNNHIKGWECDMYFYFVNPDEDGHQTVLVKDGESFPVSKADGVAIISRGRDFLHHDPRFQCGIDKWVSEGSKIGFATKLDVRAGSAFPETSPRRRNTKFGVKIKPLSIEEEEDEEEDHEPPSRMVAGATVYVRDPHYSWIPATIETEEDDKKRVKVSVRLPGNWKEQTVEATGRGAKNMKMERLVKLTDYGNDELPLQNLEKDGVTAMGKNDMADLTNLHEAAILYNLKARHAESLPYTRVGDILVAVNPFRWIDGLYAREKQEFYAENLIWSTVAAPKGRRSSVKTNNPLATAATEKKALGYDYEKLGINPHVYETSSLAYLGLAMERSDQTILVTGESGAGKTETIKIVMNHLATVEKSRPQWPKSDREKEIGGGSDTTVNRVLQATPIFEAFGNAKTLRNDNSSRFGKFTQLQFDIESIAEAREAGRAVPSCHLAGSKCITYLLEKSRVVSMSEGERTFHIFYQMLGMSDDEKRDIWEEGLMGAGTSDFSYLSKTSSDAIDGLASPENWPETREALSVFGIHGDKFMNVMRSLCVILQLGNITFDVETIDGEERAMLSARDELDKLSSLMGVSAAEIEAALTKRIMSTRGEEFTIFVNDSGARDGRDALAKEIYARIFDLLVAACNESTEPKGAPTNQYGTISLLDIFGFESFKVNKFEQLCINYCNERLQQKYVLDNFEAIKSEYEDEGINVFDFSLVDNSQVMQLLEGKLGLITQLNEECVRKNGSDENFVYKFKVVNSDSNRMIQDHLHRPYEFGIRHYAAPIKYDGRMFIERNLDKIPTDLLKCVMVSSNPLIREEFQQLSKKMDAPKSGGLKKRSEATKHLVITKFKQQLTSLMSLIETSRTRYIRCVKPNKQMSPGMMDHAHTVSQLESAGLVTAIVISRESFPNRLTYELIMERFRFLAFKFPDSDLNSGDIKVDSKMLIGLLLAGVMHDSHIGRVEAFTCGKTSIYFRTGALERLETIRQDYYAERAIQLQAWYRSLVARQQFSTLKQGMILLQCEVRCRQAYVAFTKKVRSAVTVQCFVRECLAVKELSRRRMNHASTVIQTRWRGMKPREQFITVRKAAVRLQCFNRMVLGKKEAALKKKERDEHQTINKRMSVIQQTFDDATTIQGTVFSVDEGLLDEVETMFEFLRKEIVVLRKKNTKLKKDLADAETDKREIFNHASGVDHAFSLSKIRNEQMSKTNMALLDDNNKRRKEVTNLKNELKTQQQAHELQLQEMRAEFELSLRNREIELNTIQQTLHSSAALHKREVQAVHDEAERKQEEHFSQISRLREEIKNTQDSHQDYLSKLMGVLETTQESRRNLMPPSGEMILRRKDDEIAELREEIARLSQSDCNGEDESTKKEATKSMKYIVKKNRENRKAHVQSLMSLASQIEETLASGDSAQTQQFLNLMKEAIQVGEKSNSKMDRETVNMIDNTALYTQNGVANADAALIAENEKLRRKLEKKRDRKSFRSEEDSSSILDGVETTDSVGRGMSRKGMGIERQTGSKKLGKKIGVRNNLGRKFGRDKT